MKYEMVHEKKMSIKDGSTALWNYAEELIEDSVKKGILKKGTE